MLIKRRFQSFFLVLRKELMPIEIEAIIPKNEIKMRGMGALFSMSILLVQVSLTVWKPSDWHIFTISPPPAHFVVTTLPSSPHRSAKYTRNVFETLLSITSLADKALLKLLE